MHDLRNSSSFAHLQMCFKVWANRTWPFDLPGFLCVCMLGAFAIEQPSLFLSVCQDIRHCAPKPSAGAWICITTGCSFYFNALTLFSPSMHNPSVSPFYWSCILSDVLKHSSSFCLCIRVHRGLTLVGCQQELALPYCNWLVARRPQWEHKFSHCPDLTPDLLERPISVSVTFFPPPLSLSIFHYISWKVYASVDKA